MKKLLLLLLLLIFASCSSSEQDLKSADTGIIILSPELAEIVCALDGEKYICGVTRECNYPTSLKDKTIVGSFSSPNIEKIVACNPDFVLLSGMEQDMICRSLMSLEIEVHQYFPNSLDSLYQTIRSIGKLLDLPSRADSLVHVMKDEVNSLPEHNHSPSIFVEIYHSPLMTVSDDSFVGDVLKYAGVTNIFPDLPREYCAVSSEKIVEKNPDIILLTYPGVTFQDVKERLGWDSINAVKNGNIYTTADIDPDIILRAGPRITEGILALSSITSQL